ncbi:Pvc16 family protein [Sphingosinicella sp. BN140058]|uniref:Pvc16 family protein n=1 Tax=Sphingosinicella sp. BN140058 TaxID=1892855 RepID=UPI00101111A3|nr:Pvc16 family protein [Sphingosinicella sp. BN140058]QAY79310.1 DUF4255 domain-containing protein [Sphingosinicella sp. BN140058]
MAIDLVTAAIVDAIKASLRNAPGVPPGAFNIVVGPPNGGGSADLVLFLYLITPAPELRNAERIRPFPNLGDAPQSMAPAVPLELHYLLSLGAQTSSAIAQGLAMLGDSIRAIEAASPLAVPAGGQSAVWLSLLPLTTDEMSRIWGLFPNENCRSSFAFRASPVWIDPRAPAEPIPPVTDDEAIVGRKEAA